MDGAWKQVLRDLLPDCIAFLHRELHQAIDWSRPPQLLEKELSAVARRAATGQRRVDLLAKVWLRDGQARWLLLHVEVQGQQQEVFPERIYLYHALLVLQHRQPVISLAILTDGQANWHPTSYEYDHWGCKVSFQFPILKLLDWRGREAELAAMDNPFAQVALAHLAVLTSRGRLEPLIATRRAVLRHLLHSEYDQRKFEAVLTFVDWISDLPDDLMAMIDQEIATEEGIAMTRLVSRWHEMALAMGRESGLEEGRRDLVRRQIARRCGPLDAALREDLDQLDSTRILALGEALLDFTGRDDLDRWVAANARQPA